MRRWIHALAAAGAAALLVPAAASAALTVPKVATLHVTKLTSTSAQLNGAVAPGGFPTVYQFAFGADGVYDHLTMPTAIGGGSLVYVSDVLSGLTPGTTYHTRLSVAIPVGFTGSELVFDGADVAFTTPRAGQVTVGAARLAAGARAVIVQLRCASTQPCAGSVTLRGGANNALASGRFALSAGRSSVITLRPSRALPRRALTAWLAVAPTTGQPSLTRTLRLG
jgi:hypothetical protein